MNKLLFLLLLLLKVSMVNAQRQSTEKVIDPGNKQHQWDDVHFTEITGEELADRTLADYRGKLVILDFWNVWCSNCIAAMPRLDSLQREFKGDVKILCVTTDSQQKVNNLFDRLDISFDDLSFVLDDSLLSTHFPYQTVPHHVWLDKDGKLLYNTFAHNLNSENIKKALRGEKMNVIKKEDAVFDPTIPLPLYDNVLARGEYVLFVDSLLANAPEDFETVTKDKLSIRYRGINISPATWLRNIVQMKFYGQFFGGRYTVADSLLVISPDVEEMFIKDTKDLDGWKTRSLKSYERRAFTNSFEDFAEKLLSDFSRYYDVELSWQRGKAKAWEFRKMSETSANTVVSSSAGGFKFESGGVRFTDATVDDFIRCLVLMKADQGFTLVDSANGSRINGKLASADLFSFEGIKTFLTEQGIQLQEVRFETLKLVVTK